MLRDNSVVGLVKLLVETTKHLCDGELELMMTIKCSRIKNDCQKMKLEIGN